MTPQEWTLAGLALGYAGLALLSLAMNRHHGQVWGRGSRPRWPALLRGLGWALLLLAAWPCVRGWGTGAGLAVWLAVLSLAGLLWVPLLAYRPRLAVLICLPLALLGAAAGMWVLIGA